MKFQIRDTSVQAWHKLVCPHGQVLNWLTTALVISVALVARPCVAQAPSASDQESALIQTLRSNAPGDEKAIACKKLAVYGSEAAVPALAPLLADERFASWARIALEAIPGPAADEALRKAAGKLQGRLLVGVINSIGVRRDAKSVSVLTRKLKDSDPGVASAAAVSLGKIGGRQAATALRRALQKDPEVVHSAIAEGCVRCAEDFLAVEKRADAVQLYDAVLQSSVPEERTLEALRGAILARGTAGIPLLLEQLQSENRSRFNLGLRVARELPGPETTEAVAKIFRTTTPERQPLVLLALADRKDSYAAGVVLDAARNGEKPVRLAAIESLDRSGDASGMPVLLQDATDNDSDISQPSLAALARLAGSDVDSELVNKLPDSSGKMRQVLITVAARRGTEKALPLIVQSVGDPDADIRGAAIQALTALGGNNEVAELARALQKSTVAAERSHIEKVLVTLGGRLGSGCVPSLLPLVQSEEAENRIAALHALVAAGGTDALTAVVAAIGDKDPSCQDEAVRTLSTWPNAWPEDEAAAQALLHVAKADPSSPHGIQASRAYLQFLLGDEKLKQDDKLAKLRDIMPSLQRPEEKVAAVAVLQGIHDPAALELLTEFASEPAVADAACAALVQVATENKASFSSDQRQKAMQLVVQKSTNEETKHKAEEALKNLQ